MENQEQVKKEIKQRLEKIKYRIKILDMIEEKLFKMRGLAQRVLEEELTDKEIKEINKEVQNLEEQVQLLNSQSNGVF